MHTIGPSGPKFGMELALDLEEVKMIVAMPNRLFGGPPWCGHIRAIYCFRVKEAFYGKKS